MLKYNLLIVDDHPYFRKSIQLLFQQHALIDRIDEAATAAEAIQHLRNNPVQLILLDARLQQGDGLDVADYVRQQKLRIPIIAVTSYSDASNILHLARAGANAILLKSTLNMAELEEAIEKVLSGRKFFTPEIKKLIDQNASLIDLPAIRLTDPEKKLLHFLNKGFTTKEISPQFNVTDNTIETYRKRLLERTHTHSIQELIAYAYRNGLLF